MTMWSTVESGSGTAPCSRGKHSATLLGGQVYILGGRGAGGALPLKDFWKYNLSMYILRSRCDMYAGFQGTYPL